MAGKALLYCAGGGLGDSLVASVVARALHAKYDRVDALTLPSHAQTLARVPDVDGVLVDDVLSETQLAQRLRDNRYDACVITWATPRTARVAQLAAIRVRVGQARRLYSWRFTHRVAVRSEAGDVTAHWSQILLDYARAIGCDTSDPVPRFEITPSDAEEGAAILARTGLNGAPFAVVHPTNAIAPRRGLWPVEGWVSLVKTVQQRLGLRVVLTGGHADREIVDRIARESDAYSLAGETSIGSFAAIAARAAVFCGITTGSMHVAAAVGARTVGIFPFQSDVPERWAPLGERTAVVRATYPCRPGERKETCPDYACIAQLDVARIVVAITSLLDRE